VFAAVLIVHYENVHGGLGGGLCEAICYFSIEQRFISAPSEPYTISLPFVEADWTAIFLRAHSIEEATLT
jgi:hypothetical protein